MDRPNPVWNTQGPGGRAPRGQGTACNPAEAVHLLPVLACLSFCGCSYMETCNWHALSFGKRNFIMILPRSSKADMAWTRVNSSVLLRTTI